ncbi:MAG: 4-phosphoerythronate dehydrogenase [Chitinivibrionales bacterium]|nr:4-phosphoerythronate dehydrogenase [Chitinivibrionales bacterium]
MKVIADSNIVYVKEAFAQFGDVVAVPAAEITNELCRDATILCVRSVTPVNAKLLENTSIKFVATATSGSDHIDTQYLTEEGIGFASASGSNANSVAEYVIAALVEMSQRRGIDLRTLVLGIVGAGNVGSAVFEKASIIGMRCIVNDPPKQRLTQSSFYRPLGEILENADIISLHVPLIQNGTDRTVHMVDSEFLEMMKDGAMLINTSRGAVIDENAFLKSDRRRLGGLIFDVWGNEPTINRALLPLIDIATPHIAGHSYDAKLNGTAMIYDSACAFFYAESKWDTKTMWHSFDRKVLTIQKPQPTFYDIVSAVSSLRTEDGQLRKINEYNRDTYGQYFEQLRTQYPKRYEFKHYYLQTASLSDYDTSVANGLDFHVG